MTRYVEHKGKSGPVERIASEPTFVEVLAEAVRASPPLPFGGKEPRPYREADAIIAALPDEWNPDKLRAENAAWRSLVERVLQGGHNPGAGRHTDPIETCQAWQCFHIGVYLRHFAAPVEKVVEPQPLREQFKA